MPKSRTGTIRTDEIQTACQQACPSQAIVFGDLERPERRRAAVEIGSLTTTSLLAELNTQPRTTYLAAVRNPNPDMPRSLTCADLLPALTHPGPRCRG